MKIKRPIAMTVFSAVFLGTALIFHSMVSAKNDYEWKNPAAAGKGCFPPDCEAGQFPMAIIPLVGFGGKLYSIGDKSVWTSADGVNWSSQPKTDWGARHGMRFAFFKNKLWMLGGMKTWDDFRNDVWSSSDGLSWQQTIANARWSPRRGHGLVVFKDKLWILGGEESAGRADQTPVRFFNDVWSSADGVDWTRVVENAPWTARGDHISLVFDNRMWVIGGGKNRDVWASADGRDWTCVTEKAAWSERQGNGGAVFDEKLWIFGGVEKNDVWSSGDGKNWQMDFKRAPWSTRGAAYSVVFAGQLWIFSGKTGREDSFAGDIWAMTRKTE